MKWIRAFVLFWYDFIVGDSMTLAGGGALALGAGFGLVRWAGVGIAEVAVPAAVLSTLALSLRTGAKSG